MIEIIIKNTDNFEFVCNNGKSKENLKLKNAYSWPLESYLIKDSYLQMNKKLNISEVFKNLNNSVKLINITYNVLNGLKNISYQIFSLQSQLLSLINESSIKTLEFKKSASQTINDFILIYDYLTKELYQIKSKEKNGIALAINYFNNIIQRSKNMNKEIDNLTNEFESLRTKTISIIKSIMSGRDISYEQKDVLNNNLFKMESLVDTLNYFKDNLETDLNKVRKEYDSKKKDSLTTAMFSGLGSIYEIIALANQIEDVNESKISSKLKECDKKIESLQKEINEINRKLTTNSTDINKLKEELNHKQTELVGVKEQSNVYKEVVDAIELLDKLSKKQNKNSNDLEQKVEKIATQKVQIAKERRKTIYELTNLIKTMELDATKEKDLEVSINSLISFSSCLKLIEIYLSDISLFWNDIERFCVKLINAITTINNDLDDYRKIFTEESFMKLYIYNISNWVASYYIYTEFETTFTKTREEYKSTLTEKALSRKEHWNIAKEIISKLLNIFESQIK